MRCIIFAAMVAMTLSATSQAAQIYKWVDDQGVTHFDAQPPAGRPTQQIDIQKAPSPPAPDNLQPTLDAQKEQQAIDNEVKRKVAQEQSKRADDCRILRTNLAQLQNNPRVREQFEGGLRRLSEDERQGRIVETQKAINDYCL